MICFRFKPAVVLSASLDAAWLDSAFADFGAEFLDVAFDFVELVAVFLDEDVDEASVDAFSVDKVVGVDSDEIFSIGLSESSLFLSRLSCADGVTLALMRLPVINFSVLIEPSKASRPLFDANPRFLTMFKFPMPLIYKITDL